jgi:hypothetical protein
MPIPGKFKPVKCLFALSVALCPALLKAQAAPIPIPSSSTWTLERLSVLNDSKAPFHPEIKPFARQDAALWPAGLDTQATWLSGRDRQDLHYLLRENNEYLAHTENSKKPILRHFYNTPAHLFEVDNKDFKLRVNPMLNFALGHSDRQDYLFLNQRGLDVRGVVDDKLYFHTSLLETQWQPPAYSADYIEYRRAVPGAGFHKNYNSRFFGVDKGYDFNVATAGIGVRATRHVGIELGHGMHFLGNGYRSLFLSDFGANCFYLKLNARIWRLHYQSLWMELSPVSQRMVPGNSLLPKKYAAVHYLNFKATPRLSFGFFEATVFNRSRQFELQYLNPVILYRSVEGLIGSPDNVLIGLDGRWDLFRRLRLYGQLLVDEFLLRALTAKSERGWWGNKYGIQAGVKYYNAFGIEHLDLQAEYNQVRPYTYSHFDSLNAFMHYNQVLAHPWGSNFREMVIIARYSPIEALFLQSRFLKVRSGLNDGLLNWGADPAWSNESRVQDYGNQIGQGVPSTTWIAALEAGWQFRHNLWLDLRLMGRRLHNGTPSVEGRELIFTGGIRWNVWPGTNDY